MNSDDYRERGVALAERVRAQVDTDAGLDRALRRHRRTRLTLAVAGATAVLVVFAAVAGLLRTSTDRAAAPTTTNALSTNLPVTVYLALLGDFTVDDPEAGDCSGSGVHAAVRKGATVGIVSADDAELGAFTLGGAGAVIDAARSRALDLPTAQPACLFELGTLRIDAGALTAAAPRIGVGEWPSPTGGGGVSRAGQQVVYYSAGEQP